MTILLVSNRRSATGNSVKNIEILLEIMIGKKKRSMAADEQ